MKFVHDAVAQEFKLYKKWFNKSVHKEYAMHLFQVPVNDR